MSGESVVHRAKLSLWPYFLVILLGVLGIFAFGLGLLILLALWIKFASTELAVTNKRIMVKVGFISRQTIELNLSRLESIKVHQSIFGRIFGFGTIIISGAGNPQAPVKGIRDPMAFRRAALNAQEQGSAATAPQAAATA
jgi:uncharacterized membrane protein YdbT with pleckstrin-like domain